MIAGLHLVTADQLAGDELRRVVAAAVEGGASVVQVRAKDATSRAFVDRVLIASAAVDGRATLLVNDRVDIALAARLSGARVDGVHLGQDDLDPRIARDLLGPESVIGWTADHADHLATLDAFPAGTVDYLGVGALRATATKLDHPPSLGIGGFAAFASRAPLPCIAIGGVTADDVPALTAAGAAGVAVVSAICAAADPLAATRTFTDALAAVAR